MWTILILVIVIILYIVSASARMCVPPKKSTSGQTWMYVTIRCVDQRHSRYMYVDVYCTIVIMSNKMQKKKKNCLIRIIQCKTK